MQDWDSISATVRRSRSGDHTSMGDPDGLSVGSPGPEKSSVTPLPSSQRSSAFETNSGP